MTDKEIVQALRCISTPELTHLCTGCKYRKRKGCDADEMNKDAIRLIEQLIAENADLRKEIEWKDMVIALAQRKQAEAEAERDALLDIAKNGKDCDTCKHCEVCVQPGIDVAHWCDRCVEKCPCHGCGGDHWEWRGLPEAPEEGDKHGTTDK